jgi:predicted nuclease of restriction endonuclease-like (RecB) superfamily
MDQLENIEESEYNSILRQAVAVFEKARVKTAKSVSLIVNTAYWEIGKLLYERKLESAYGNRIVKRLSTDLKQHYPSMGLSPRQLWNMKKFYIRYMGKNEKLLQAVAVLPWSHNLLMLSKKHGLTDEQVLFYANEVIAKGWDRDLLLNAIKLKMHESITPVLPDNNFSTALPKPQANYANEVFRSNYNLGFLGVTESIAELELERRLVEKVKLFLLELGKGFTYIGNQHVLEYNGKESKVDMLFFHRGLRCLVAIDLKIGAFKPEYVGKMNYYLSLLDRLERGEEENRSIGIILCAEKDHLEVELALEDLGKPIGVAEYQLILPKKELEQVVKDEIVIYERDQKRQKG